ncbi:sigma-70 family RNA polymerase sigma factor [Sandaracinobacter sp. RS1-74]|uniref:RNA polymerase sigma factor n=1 Tax=Sandaracinobacteroides sayramensis TaxID=2913411 RepID=UPI001EDAF5DF|nr:sigma-70 family RNA polymerase sigma factor [Sandaracinobacteroides sayramensis]MCG2840663.1 sigma-70 family RNA polymerase sigma factor [Sandaracinobacteroides sayramensis]
MPTNAIALTRLLLAERPSLVRLAQRIVGSVPAAEDVTQSLWFRVQRVEDDPPIANRRAYLFRLATNLAVDRAKADHRHGELFKEGPLSEDVADESPLAERMLLDREALGLVQSAVRELSPRCRKILHMRRVEGLPASEIASRLGLSRQMVTRYIAQAMAHCLDRLDPDE